MKKIKLTDMPEHILEEIKEATNEMHHLIVEFALKQPPNIVLNSLGLLLSMYIGRSISDNENIKEVADAYGDYIRYWTVKTYEGSNK